MRRLHTTAPRCPHDRTVHVVAHHGAGPAERLTICRDCYRVPGPYATSRWVHQDEAVTLGAHLTPWPSDPGAAACFKAPAFMGDPDPPMLVPTVDPAALPFDRDAKVGGRVAFLASLGFLQWIEGVVVAVGEDGNGARGIVALTTQGLTLRGSERVYAGWAGGLPFWGVDFFGDEDRLAEVVAAHRAAYPVELVAAVTG